jgi:L-ascorbate metabolism protein UlaG (beta-lactamase superfamily)
MVPGKSAAADIPWTFRGHDVLGSGGILVKVRMKRKRIPPLKYLLAIAACTVFAFPAQAQVPNQVQTFDTSAGPVKITPIYHASVRIEAGGKTIYVDPTKPFNFAGQAPADLILITDIHGDHMDPAAVATLSKQGTEVWTAPAVAKTLTTATVLSNGDVKKWGAWTIEAIPMYNIVRGPEPGKLYHDKGRGNGYVLTYGGKRFYFSGDTENIPEMRALKNIDVAFICMNLPNTMTTDEAADAAKAFHPKVVIPYHYRKADLSLFKNAMEGSGIEVRILDFYPPTA